MIKFLKKINKQFDLLLYDLMPRKPGPSDCFAFKDDADKQEWQGDCLDQKRKIVSSHPLLKVFLIIWLGGTIWFVGSIIYSLL